MNRKKKRRAVLEYGAGFAALALALALAWFFPGWYGHWQDQRLLGQVNLSSRENIEYIDTASLSMAGKMQRVTEAASYAWTSLDSPSVFQINQCRNAVEAWCRNGLLPEQCADWILEENLISIDNALVILYGRDDLQQGVLPVSVQHYYSPGDGSGFSALTLVMDQELDMLYFAALSGSDAADYLGSRWKPARSGAALTMVQEDFTGTDFAYVCGASYYHVVGSSKNILTEDVNYITSLNVSLTFDSFDSYAYRRAIEDNAGEGFAVFYGARWWLGFVSEFFAAYGIDDFYQFSGVSELPPEAETQALAEAYTFP